MGEFAFAANALSLFGGYIIAMGSDGSPSHFEPELGIHIAYTLKEGHKNVEGEPMAKVG